MGEVLKRFCNCWCIGIDLALKTKFFAAWSQAQLFLQWLINLWKQISSWTMLRFCKAFKSETIMTVKVPLKQIAVKHSSTRKLEIITECRYFRNNQLQLTLKYLNSFSEVTRFQTRKRFWIQNWNLSPKLSVPTSELVKHGDCGFVTRDLQTLSHPKSTSQAYFLPAFECFIVNDEFLTSFWLVTF